VAFAIWPSCIVVPAGYRIGPTVRGKADYLLLLIILPKNRATTKQPAAIWGIHSRHT
jgi:hypothetical protein